MSEQTKVFGRDEIIAAKAKRNVIRIDDVPGLGGSVYIQELKKSEFQEWMQMKEQEDSKIVAKILCDEGGALLFDCDNADDIKALEESLTTQGLAYIGLKAIAANSASPEAIEKKLLASLISSSSTT